MKRHPIDQVSAVLGVVTIAIGIAVIGGAHPADLQSDGGTWVAAAALLLGVGLVPWRHRPSSAGDTSDDVVTDRPTGGHEADDG